ncbi:hypothetical protein MKY30_02175 [Oceanobacillus sp. FSL W8-0428]|uniref:hypothetical protein n=1 Tax=Oceanobacillus TaxID=182709 RepID=UPI0012EEB17B
MDSWAYSYGIIAGETLEVLTSLAFGFTLFLFVSHIFYTWGKDALRMKIQHSGKHEGYI